MGARFQDFPRQLVAQLVFQRGDFFLKFFLDIEHGSQARGPPGKRKPSAAYYKPTASCACGASDKVRQREQSVRRPGRHHRRKQVDIAELIEQQSGRQVCHGDCHTDADAGHGAAVPDQKTERDRDHGHDQREHGHGKFLVILHMQLAPCRSRSAAGSLDVAARAPDSSSACPASRLSGSRRAFR